MRTELVTNLEQRASELLAELKRDGGPILIVQHGVPRAVLVDVDGYERLKQRVAILEGLVRAEAAAAAAGRRTSNAEGKEPAVRRREDSGPAGDCARGRSRLGSERTVAGAGER